MGLFFFVFVSPLLPDERLCWRYSVSHRGLYGCSDYKRYGTLRFDLLATVQCNCSHIWKVHIGHSPLSIFLQLNGWLCLGVKKWAILPALASCLIGPNLYFIKMMTHCTHSPSPNSCSIDLLQFGSVVDNKSSWHRWQFLNTHLLLYV